MLRFGTLFFVLLAMPVAATAADQMVVRQTKHPPARHKFKTVITAGAPATPRRSAAYRDPDLLFTPALPYIPPLIRAPLLPGSATLPGYYGSANSYDYPGPYYGGPEIGYWNRLPYACGVYGYC